MKGVYLDVDQTGDKLALTVIPSEVEDKLNNKVIVELVNESFSQWAIFDEVISSVVSSYTELSSANSNEPITMAVAEKRDAEINFTIPDDEMTATLSITSAYGGEPATLESVNEIAKAEGIIRGLSNKLVESVINKSQQLEPGELVQEIVAKGLPAKDGLNSKAIPLFESLQDRLLRPKEKGDGKVDMRDFGDIISVKAGTKVLRFEPPTDGRNGYTVTDKPVLAVAGVWGEKKLGAGVAESDEEEYIVVATEDGVPKFEDGCVSVEDVFTSPGCNVSTGNINYDGDIIINGDVSEQMEITSTGNVTVNGFVESATIVADGSITIVQGATGKMNDELTDSTTLLQAKGNIHIEQGRGLKVKSHGDVTIGKQLAFSSIESKGSVIAGTGDVPGGAIYASDIFCLQKVKAGKLGAVSGSRVYIDFSSGLSKLKAKKKQLESLGENLTQSIQNHDKKMQSFEKKTIPENLVKKLEQMKKLNGKQRKTLTMILKEIERIQARVDDYEKSIGIEIYKKLHSGVIVKLNKRVWEAKDEYNRATVTIKNGKWHYEPMVN